MRARAHHVPQTANLNGNEGPPSSGPPSSTVSYWEGEGDGHLALEGD